MHAGGAHTGWPFKICDVSLPCCSLMLPSFIVAGYVYMIAPTSLRLQGILRTKCSSQRLPTGRIVLMQCVTRKRKTKPAKPRNQHKERPTTQAEDNCKKQCGASVTTPQESHIEEAATLQTQTKQANKDLKQVYIQGFTQMDPATRYLHPHTIARCQCNV